MAHWAVDPHCACTCGGSVVGPTGMISAALISVHTAINDERAQSCDILSVDWGKPKRACDYRREGVIIFHSFLMLDNLDFLTIFLTSCNSCTSQRDMALQAESETTWASAKKSSPVLPQSLR